MLPDLRYEKYDSKFASANKNAQFLNFVSNQKDNNFNSGQSKKRDLSANNRLKLHHILDHREQRAVVDLRTPKNNVI